MSELLCNEKYFYSMIKRSEDHRIIDVNMSNTIVRELGDINEYIVKLDSVSEDQNNDNGEVRVIDIEGMKSYLNQIKDKNNEDSQLMFTFEREKALYSTHDEDWKSIVRKCVNEACSEVFGDNHIGNIVVFNEYSSGITGDVYFYDYNGIPIEITNVSNINRVIEAEYRFLPKIYIYVLSNEKENSEKKRILLSSIGCKLGHEVAELIKAGISELLADNKKEVNSVCVN